MKEKSDLEPIRDDCANLFNSLQNDHQTILSSAIIFEQHLQNIEKNTRDLADTIKEFRNDSREYVGLIAGKKQVPISIFVLVVLVLVALIAASEARYSNVDISLGGNKGIVVSPKD